MKLPHACMSLTPHYPHLLAHTILSTLHTHRLTAEHHLDEVAVADQVGLGGRLAVISGSQSVENPCLRVELTEAAWVGESMG